MLRALLYRLLCLVSLLFTVSISYALPCHSAGRRVAVEGVSRVTHLSSSGVNLWLDVSNERCHRLVVSRGEVDIAINGVRVATIALRERVRVARRSSGEVLLPLRFRSYSPLPVLQVLREVLRGEVEGVTISYKIRGGVGIVRRTFSAENIAISEFFDNFAISREFIGTLDAELK